MPSPDYRILYLRPARLLLHLNLAFALMHFTAIVWFVGPLLVTDPERAAVRLTVYWALPTLGGFLSLVYLMGSWLDRRYRQDSA